jgi:hypothetical protein
MIVNYFTDGVVCAADSLRRAANMMSIMLEKTWQNALPGAAASDVNGGASKTDEACHIPNSDAKQVFEESKDNGVVGSFGGSFNAVAALSIASGPVTGWLRVSDYKSSEGSGNKGEFKLHDESE